MSTPGDDKTTRLVALLEELLGEMGGPGVEAGPQAAELHAEAARRDADVLARYTELTARDHLIGLEATNSRLLRDLRRARSRVRDLEARLAEREAELDAMRGSRTWRAGRLIAAPLRRLRG